MKSIFTLMVTIFMYSSSFGQNSNDCNITPNTIEFETFKLNESNINVKSLNSFIEKKKKEKDDLKLLQPSENKQLNNTYETDYDKFKKYRLIITEFKYPIEEKEIIIHETQYNALKELRFLITQNIDIFDVNNDDNRITNIKNGFDSYKTLNFQIIKIPTEKDSLKDNSKEYQVDKKSFEEFAGSLDYIKMTDFNACQLILKKNLDNVYKDIETAENYLNDLSSRELTEFSFKKHIMVIVGALIAIILVCFFTGVLYKASDAVKQKLIGETGLQFITIFVIIIAVILFGVMNILKGSELAAILSAIAGYILGKTAPPKSDKTLEIELEILKLKSEEAQRLKQEAERLEQEEADKKVAEVAEAIKKQEEEKRKLEIEAENKKLEAEEIQDDVNTDTTNESVKEYVDQVAEILSEDTDVNTIKKSDEFDEPDESNEGIDEKK